MATNRAVEDTPGARRPNATPTPIERDARYYDEDQPGMGDVLGGGDATRAPRSLRESERRPKDGAILAGDDWDNPDEI